MRTLKVFCSPDEWQQLARKHALIERYQGFVLLETSPAVASELAERYVVEDVTNQFTIRSGDELIEPKVARVRAEAKEKVRARPVRRSTEKLPPGPHHYLVQFIGPIKQTWLQAVRRAGGEARAPYGGFTYVVRAREKAIARIAKLRFVRWVGHLPWRNRLTKFALETAGRLASEVSVTLPRTKTMPGTYTVEYFAAKDLEKSLPFVRRLGLKVLASEPSAKTLVVGATGTRPAVIRALTGLSAVHGVRAIRQKVIKRTSNDVAASLIGTAKSLAVSGLGLSGKGEVVGVCDTGLDSGDPETIHPDFVGRLAWIKSYPITPDFDDEVFNPRGNDGPADVDTGHGTHVAGSVLGSGRSSAGLSGTVAPIRGLAFEAKLVFQAVEQEMKWRYPEYFNDPGRYILAGIPNDLKKLFGDAYGRGARIHSNSWGGGSPGAYDDQCQQLDEFVATHRDLCVVVAAGNDGTDKDGDGKINPMSVSSPGTAKNCITVGACENLRPDFSAQFYGRWWPDDYPAPPFDSDPMADDPQEVVPFSSRGPTQDGRTKPDVVAPGTFILSTRSRRIAPNNKAWAAFVPSRLYFFMGGTSMAAPLTAGAVAVIRQFLRTRRNIASPSAALLKACVIAGARRLPGPAPAGTVLDNDQGFGRVNLDAVLAPMAPSSALFMDVKAGLRTGQVHSQAIDVKSNKVPLRVVLAYTDAPGPTLINNLNLMMRSPSGKAYVGNQRNTSLLAPDAQNNVEVIHVARPAAGTWQVQVVASNVPVGSQDFAAVCLGHI